MPPPKDDQLLDDRTTHVPNAPDSHRVQRVSHGPGNSRRLSAEGKGGGRPVEEKMAILLDPQKDLRTDGNSKFGDVERYR